jgi:hypothetical protein
MVVSKVPNLTHQTYFFEKNHEKYPEDWVRDRQSEGYRLTSCGYVQNSWALVMSKIGKAREEIILGPQTKFPDEKIKELIDKGYKISLVCAGFLPSTASAWIVAMARTADYTTQHLERSKQFPYDVVRAHWNEGYRITSIANDGEWAVVLSKGPGLEKLAQTYFHRHYFPTGGIFSGLADGLHITGAAGF